MPRKAAIVAVGSELLSGQITNRNAAWISGQLFDIGIDSRCHLTVDDVESEIIAAFDVVAADVDLIFVTGGLGPTSDDLTRQAVARWCGEDLRFDEGSWKHIQTLFSRFSNTVPETNRQQCYFPASATVLQNAAGTANAFTIKARGKQIWVLPGPPREVETIWNDHIAAALTSLIPIDERKILRMWRTVGKGESHLAELIEPLIKDRGVEVAYRAHAPFVETKIRFPATHAKEGRALCDELETALSPWIYEIDRQDLPTQLAKYITRFSIVEIFDGVTHGNLQELLSPALRAHLKADALVSAITAWETQPSPREFMENMLALNADAELQLAVAGPDASGTWVVGLRIHDDRRIVECPSPYKGDAMAARNEKAIAALTVKAWYDLLTGDLN